MSRDERLVEAARRVVAAYRAGKLSDDAVRELAAALPAEGDSEFERQVRRVADTPLGLLARRERAKG